MKLKGKGKGDFYSVRTVWISDDIEIYKPLFTRSAPMVADAGLGLNPRTASLNSGETAPSAFQNSLNTTLQQNNGCVNDETIISQIKKAQKIRGPQANTGITSASQNPGSVSQGTANVTQSPEEVGLVACESHTDKSILRNGRVVNDDTVINAGYDVEFSEEKGMVVKKAKAESLWPNVRNVPHKWQAPE